MIFLFNMGVPMIFPTMYFMVLALIPIVLIESWYISRSLGIKFVRIIPSIGLGNVVSTIVGIPFTWTVLFAIQMFSGGTSSYDVSEFARKILSVTVQAPWLLPFGPEEFWMFHAAALFLLIPFFLATWLIEYWIVRNKLSHGVVERDDQISTEAAEGLVFRVVRNANLISYGLIALLLIISLVSMTVSRP